jgi:hypothetical protein
MAEKAWIEDFSASDFATGKYPGCEEQLSTISWFKQGNNKPFSFGTLPKTLFKKPIDLLKLDRLVQRYGGYDAIQDGGKAKWIELFNESLHGPNHCDYVKQNVNDKKNSIPQRGAATLRELAFRMMMYKRHGYQNSPDSDSDDDVSPSSVTTKRKRDDPLRSATATTTAPKQATLYDVKYFTRTTPNGLLKTFAEIPTFSIYSPVSISTELREVFADCVETLGQEKKTLGLLGRNNVGKSSLLNAILEISTISQEDYVKANTLPVSSDQANNEGETLGGVEGASIEMKSDEEIDDCDIDNDDLVRALRENWGGSGTVVLNVKNLPCSDSDARYERVALRVKSEYGRSRGEFATVDMKLAEGFPKDKTVSMTDFVLRSSSVQIQADATTRFPLRVTRGSTWSFEIEYETRDDLIELLKEPVSDILEDAADAKKNASEATAEKKRIEALRKRVIKTQDPFELHEEIERVAGKTIKFFGKGQNSFTDRIAVRNRMHLIVRFFT